MPSAPAVSLGCNIACYNTVRASTASLGLNSLFATTTTKRIGDAPDFAVHLVQKVEQLYF